MYLIDTHTHLYVDAFDIDQKEVIERAMAVGVNYFIIPAIDSSHIKRMYACLLYTSDAADE